MLTKNVSRQWYDRNPVGRGSEYDNVISPAATTTRWTYTVPANKKFAVQAMGVHAIRYTAAAPADIAGARISYTPSGGSITKVIFAPGVTNTVGDGKAISVGSTLTLATGDAISCITFDTSTGGSYWMFGGMMGIEFDA